MKFTIYSKLSCPYCTKIKMIMEMANLDHNILVLDEHFTKEEFISKFGNKSTFPQVIMGDTNLGGCVDTITYLQKNNLI